jgi:hypothetical protein
MHVVTVAVVQAVVAHTASSIAALGEKAEDPKLSPLIVMVPPPEATRLEGSA